MFELVVFLNRKLLPTPAKWIELLRNEVPSFAFSEGMTWSDKGFRPVKLDGVDTGFELYAGKNEEDAEDLPRSCTNKDYSVTLAYGSKPRQLEAAFLAAGMLAKASKGVLMN